LFKDINALEFCRRYIPWKISELKIEECCVLSAEEMIGVLEPGDLSFSKCYLVTNPERERAFCLTKEAQKKLSALEIKLCFLNGKALTYQNLVDFLIGKRHVEPVDENIPVIEQISHSFWRPNDIERTK
jgi:hypothetical protein